MTLEESIMEQLQRYISSDEGTKQVKDFMKRNRKGFTSGVEVEATKLRRCIQAEIDKYYSSYYPKIYSRTAEWQKSLIITNNNDGDIILTFDSRRAYHQSLFGNKETYVPILMDSGWKWKRQPTNGPIYRYTYFDGTNYIHNGIENYMKTASAGIRFVLNQTDYYGKITKETFIK